MGTVHDSFSLDLFRPFTTAFHVCKVPLTNQWMPSLTSVMMMDLCFRPWKMPKEQTAHQMSIVKLWARHTHTQKHFGDWVALQMTGFQMKMIRIKKSYVCVLGCLPLYQMYIIGGFPKPFGTKWVHFYNPRSGVFNLHDFHGYFLRVEGLERNHHLFSSVTKNQPTWNIYVLAVIT